jgi:hypothetical protein
MAMSPCGAAIAPLLSRRAGLKDGRHKTVGRVRINLTFRGAPLADAKPNKTDFAPP